MIEVDNPGNSRVIGDPYRDISAMVLEQALRDVSKRSGAMYEDACHFFESDGYCLYADMLDLRYEDVMQLYRNLRDGEKDYIHVNRPTTKEERAEMLRRYEGGQCVSEIAEALGRSDGTVSKALRQVRDISTRKRVTEEEAKNMRVLRAQGYSYIDIGKMLGRSHTTVMLWTA